MALALALGNIGKLQNIEFMGNSAVGRKIVLHMDGGMKSPHARRFGQIGEVAKGAESLNMILRTCANGFDLNSDSIKIGRELLKGAMDLEESLKMLMALHDGSDFMHKPKFLMGKEEDESEPRRRNQAGSRSKFSFIRESRSEKPKNQMGNFSRNSSKVSALGSSSLKSARSMTLGSHENARFSGDRVSSVSNQNQSTYKANQRSDKVRIPNVIAKLMGLEELPSLTDSKQSNEISKKLEKLEEDINKKQARIVANSTKSMLIVEEEEEEEGMNNMAKNNIKSSSNSDHRSSASKDPRKNNVGKTGQMEVNNMNQKNEPRIRMEARLQDEINTVNQPVKVRAKYIIIPAAGNSLSDHTNDINVRKKIATGGMEENVQQSKEKFEQTYSKVKKTDPNYEQKRSLSISYTKLENGRKKELALIQESDAKSKNKVNQKIMIINSNRKTIMDDKKVRNQGKGKELIEQIPEKRLPLKRDSRNMSTTSIPTIAMVKQKSSEVKLQRDTNRGRSVDSLVQNKVQVASQSMKIKNSILEELENRWKERNKKVQGTEKCASSTLNFGCSSHVTGDEKFQSSAFQPTQEELNVKFERESSTSQLPGTSYIDPPEIGPNIICTYPSMELEEGKSTYQDWKTKNEEHEVLTKQEENLKQILTTSQDFLNIAEKLLQIKTPVDIIQTDEQNSRYKDSRLVIDCCKELLKRKQQREEANFTMKSLLLPSKKRNIDTLIKELNADLESLKYQTHIDGSYNDLAEFLQKMIEKEIQQTDPHMNCMWEFGWGIKAFVCLERDAMVKEVGRHILNVLLNELTRDLLGATFHCERS